ncbi:MAG: SDR family oxidoreductase [Acidobacteriota bacterium]
MGLHGKTAVVTAAAQGIGRATAEAFAKAGARVWATDVNAAKLAELRDVAGIATATLDVTDADQIRNFEARTGAIDILFNCAGFVHNGAVLDCLEKEWDAAFDLNVKSMWRMIQAFLPGMIAKGEGVILNMSSIAGLKGVPSRCAYSTTKAAVIGLTKSVAVDYIKQGIRCNAICPGTVESPSLEERLRAQGDYQQARAAFVARQPIGRLGQPQEIADLAVYLAGATYTTGAVHVIDGGWTA